MSYKLVDDCGYTWPCGCVELNSDLTGLLRVYTLIWQSLNCEALVWIYMVCSLEGTIMVLSVEPLAIVTSLSCVCVCTLTSTEFRSEVNSSVSFIFRLIPVYLMNINYLLS